MALGDGIFDGIKGSAGNIVTYAIWGIIAIVVLTILIFIAVWFYRKKKWNLRVEVKLPRSDGKIINSEKAKGHYSVHEGIVDIKRKGMKAVGMKPFDVREFVQGTNFLEVQQVGPDQYIPIHPKSYTKLTDDKGNEISILDIYADIPKRKTWKNYFERVAKERFSLSGFLSKYGQILAFGILIFLIFIGFAVVWMRMPSMCGV